MPARRKKVLAISGSIRKDSSNERILKAIADAYAPVLDMHIYYEIGTLPYFNPDLDNPDAESLVTVKTFRALIEASDAVIICTPEYVFSLPGVLKNALEWTVSTTVFSYKPFAFIVASASGEQAFQSLDLVMRTLLQVPVPGDCKLLIKGARGRINSAGAFASETTWKEVRALMDALMNNMEHSSVSTAE